MEVIATIYIFYSFKICFFIYVVVQYFDLKKQIYYVLSI